MLGLLEDTSRTLTVGRASGRQAKRSDSLVGRAGLIRFISSYGGPEQTGRRFMVISGAEPVFVSFVIVALFRYPSQSSVHVLFVYLHFKCVLWERPCCQS